MLDSVEPIIAWGLGAPDINHDTACLLSSSLSPFYSSQQSFESDLVMKDRLWCDLRWRETKEIWSVLTGISTWTLKDFFTRHTAVRQQKCCCKNMKDVSSLSINTGETTLGRFSNLTVVCSGAFLGLNFVCGFPLSLEGSGEEIITQVPWKHCSFYQFY